LEMLTSIEHSLAMRMVVLLGPSLSLPSWGTWI